MIGKNSKKLLGLLLIMVFIIGGLLGCFHRSQKTITNLDEGVIEEIKEIKDHDMVSEKEIGEEENKESLEKEKKDKKDIQEKAEKEIEAVSEEEKITKNKEVTENKEIKENKKATEETNTEENTKKERDNPVTIIDGVEYTNYKGPVQGEIKYVEGRPADEASAYRKASGDIGSPYQVDLRVTTNFGHSKMYAENVGMVKDEVGMEVLFRNLDIQTAYGGGFVNAINGVESKFTFFTGSQRKKEDWFYWVNGILAPIGVAEYRPEPGDVIWWDFHDWETTMFIPAVIGAYPQPFKSGFMGSNPGTVIMYTEAYEKEAEELKQSLQNQGVKKVDIAVYDAKLLENPARYYIVLGIWDELVKESTITNSRGREINLLEETNDQNKFIGVYAKFDEGKLHALDFKGNKKTSYSQAGTIYAYAAGLGAIRPIWIVSGTDDRGVRMAFETLLNQPEKIKDTFGVVVSEKGIEKIPYTQ
ncbi:DUF4430 domain-containing protein [Clostridium formicaceticum]|uniref:Transcobalamin-like C-terminal domain-containing protein n=1 Tax=Clostridium formicaceticum TaxID=1497 RepID=A0AAC9RIN6_9CLOT|nr:DUF4430 domain-containing protein [Clostridium formicaceticum]AOY75881.1 hypothetical protein BJL90_08230 [Clostridium formicaceticum]ARE86222.1 hypothetical protein CLFO_05440 [Clostridium formicaceticum]